MQVIELLFSTVLKIGSLSITFAGYTFTFMDMIVFSCIAGAIVYLISGIFKG